MFENTITNEGSLKRITAKGRIDALSSSEIQEIFDELILAGERIFLVDMAAVNYVSSAGLRVFISTQKALKKVRGEIILAGLVKPVLDIFNMSGLTTLFRIIDNKDAIAGLFPNDPAVRGIFTRETEEVSINYIEKEGTKGSLFSVGSQDKMGNSLYAEEDVAAVASSRMQFGCGLAALGNIYDEYKALFGESMVVNNNFFFYPAVKHPSVDFMIEANRDPAITYKFLHGFGFNGSYRYILSFQNRKNTIDLTALIKMFFTISEANLLGIVLLAESKGFWGMHIKKSPLAERKPEDGEGIFSATHFPDWFDFPVEPSHSGHIIVATGIAVREGSLLRPEYRHLISGPSTFHMHGGIFDKTPIGNDVHSFDSEIMRVFRELTVYKIEHMLGHSAFAGGMAALIELEV